MMSVLMCGCDTVAEISFDNEQVIELEPFGILPVTCGDAGGGDALFRFNARTSQDRRLVPGIRLAGMDEGLLPGSTVSAENVIFSDGWAFEIAADGADRVCVSEEDCGAGASCLSPEQMGLTSYYYAPDKYCVVPLSMRTHGELSFTHYRSAGVEAGRVVSRNASGRAVAFVMDNSASLDGSNVDGAANDDLATDPFQYRRTGLVTFMDTLAESGNGPYEFSMHFANGSGASGVYDAAPGWLRSFAAWTASVMNRFPTPSGGSPIWEACVAALAKLTDTSSSTYSRTMVVFTDGEPNGGAEDVHTEFLKKLVTSPDVAMSWIDYSTEGSSPVREYAESTQKQCGVYYHFHSASQIPAVMRRIAYATESWWEVGMDFGGQLSAGTAYRIACRIALSVGNGAAVFEAQRRLENQAVIDERFVLVR